VDTGRGRIIIGRCEVKGQGKGKLYKGGGGIKWKAKVVFSCA
jgi:hypothetical protein